MRFLRERFNAFMFEEIRASGTLRLRPNHSTRTLLR
jgi:hypothetical protein